MEKELTIKDRLIILSGLPQENDVATLKIIRGIQEDLGITEKEWKNVEMNVKDGDYRWNQEKDTPKKFDIGEKATDIIIEAFKKLNNQKKINIGMIETYELFIPNSQ